MTTPGPAPSTTPRSDAPGEDTATLRAIFDASVDAIGVARDGIHVRMNPAYVALFGYSDGAELEGIPIIDLIAPAERAAVAERAHRRVRGETVAPSYETRGRRRDGTEFDMDVRVSTFEADGATFSVVILRDITERHRAEEALQLAIAQLREADRRKDEFIAMLSHELRGPLAPICNSVFLLEHAVPGTEQARRAQAVIARQSAHLARLVDDLLDLNRISRGKIELQRDTVDLCELVRRATDDHHDRFAAAGVTLDAAVPPEPVWLDADPTRVSQIVGNLLGNACKFTPRGGRVEVRVTTAGADAVLHVRDTGAGIPPDLLHAIFEPFTQGAQPLARSQGGLGLGLALVRGFAEMHGGTVAAASEGPGRGADFEVQLPRLLGAVARPPRAPAARAERALRVLVVEDDRAAAESLREVLELLGHEAQVAEDGASGLAAARAAPPDVVLCDLGLPDGDGCGVARALRQEAALAACRLVALTGFAQPEDVTRALAAGFEHHLAKPPDLTALRALLARLAQATARDDRG